MLRWRWLTTTLAAAALACSAPPAGPDPVCVKPARPTVVVQPPPADVSCPSAAELDRIDSEVKITFEGATAGGPLVCRAIDGSRDLNIIQRHYYRSLLLLKRLSFDTPLRWTERPVYDWFRLAIEGIRVRDDINLDGCCSPARVINLRGVYDFVTEWGYLEALVHEARHADGKPHTCGTNDNTIAEMGAYGVTHDLMLWIGSHWPAATDQERAYGLYRAAVLRAGPFCKECVS
jgi:hypothetical protein